MSFEIYYVYFLTSASFIAIDGPIMDKKPIMDILERYELSAYFNEAFGESTTPTLHQLMYTGQKSDEWVKYATQVGTFLTKLKMKGAREDLGQSTATTFNSPCALHDWLTTSSKDNFKSTIPDRLLQAYDADNLSRRAAEAIQILDQKDHLCLQSIETKNIKVPSSQVLFNPETVKPRFGPASLDTAIFLADVLLMYYKQTGVLEHGDQWKTVELLQKFGDAVHEEGTRHSETKEQEQNFWSKVSLLTGWQIVHRFSTKDNMDEILHRDQDDPSSVIESGLRLINNKRVNSLGFLVNVALALLY